MSWCEVLNMWCWCSSFRRKTFNDKRLHYQWICPGPHQRSHHCLLFCSMSYLLIYSSTLPLPFITSLLISPIKINPHLKISTLVLQRGCCREGDGLCPSASLTSSNTLPSTCEKIKKENIRLCLCFNLIHTVELESKCFVCINVLEK